MVDRLDDEATRVVASIAAGPRLVVTGSTSFWGADSRELCELIAGELALIDPIVAVTGGMDGVGITFGKSFASTRTQASLHENLFHLLPRGFGPCNCGITLGAGIDFHERREILGRIGDVCLVIEGGPGTEHEATVASSRNIPVIPLGRTGGHAGDLYSQMTYPKWAPTSDWAVLGNVNATQQEVALSVRRLVQAAISIDARASAHSGGSW
jgi:hypothetical protein